MLTALTTGATPLRQLSDFTSHWLLVQQRLAGLLSWEEMLTGAVRSDPYTHMLFRSISVRALALLKEYNVPHYLGTDAMAVSFSQEVLVMTVTQADQTISFIQDGDLLFVYELAQEHLDVGGAAILVNEGLH